MSSRNLVSFRLLFALYRINLNNQIFIFLLQSSIEPSPESISNHQSPRQVAVVGADEDYSYEFSADSSMFNDSYQCIRFQAFQQNTWHLLFDRNLKELLV